MKIIPQFEPSFDEAEAQALYDYMKSGGWATEFRKTEEFEHRLAEWTGTKHCVVTNNGTISLTLALLAAGIGAGDEVLVPDLSMIATANAVTLFGAKPVFVDVNPKNLCMDLSKAEAAITTKTTCLIYVSLNGRSGPMDEVNSFCKKHKLFFLEDAAQSLGSFHNNQHLGSFGDVGSFSFSMPKIITTGQGGALITNNGEIAGKIRRLKDFGRSRGGIDLHETIGYNFKFTDIQAVLGLEQMKKLPERIVKKKALYRYYQQQLASLQEVSFLLTDLNQTTPWFVDIYTKNPDKLSQWLKEKGIGTRRLYPPIHLQKAYQTKAFCPHTSEASSRGLWLPSSTQLEDSEIRHITQIITDFFENSP